MSGPNLKRDNYDNVVQGSYGDKSFRGEYDGDNLIYVGFAIAGSSESSRVWQIKKLAYSDDNLVSITWPQDPNAKASTEYSFSWTNRASYTYS